MVLKIENIGKEIKKTRVLDNISMELHSGRAVGLKGRNGSGKTMLMRMIAGLIFPTEGRITIDGEVLGTDIAFPKSIGILLENPAFLENHTGYQNLKILADIEGKIGDKEINKAIWRVGLDSNDLKKYKKYSLGMKQRLGIAAAIMEKPDLLILDEPTNALDDSGIELLQKIVREETERGALVILSCHDGELLKGMTDEIYELDCGRARKVENNE